MTRRPARRPSLALAALILAAGAHRGQSGSASDGGGDFARVLASCEGASAEELETLAADLATLESASELWLEHAVALAEERTPAASPRARELLLERAAPLLGRYAAVQAVAAGAQGERAPEWRRAALELLRHHGAAGELALAIRLGEEPSDGALPSLRAAFEAAACAILRRDPGALDELERLSLPADGRADVLVGAVGRSGHARGLLWLCALLDDPALGGLALVEIGRLAPRAERELAKRVAPALQPVLDAADAGRRRHAMRALVDLDDLSSIPRLIRFLEEGEPGERRSALQALQRLTGCRLGEEPATWLSWYREERRWWREEATRVVAQLDSGVEEHVLVAIDELARHRLRRDELASAVATRVRHGSPGVRALACSALQRLGSDAVLGKLVEALDDAEEPVRTRAWEALRAITGRDLPAERDAWEEELR